MAGKISGVTPYDQERILIITADDFGASENINDGIKIAADKRQLLQFLSCLISQSLY